MKKTRSLKKLFVLFVGLVSFMAFGMSAEAAPRKVKVLQKGTCSSIQIATIKAPTSRGGNFKYKSNWSTRFGRELTFFEGNHSQKGAAFLFLAAHRNFPDGQSINVMDSKRNIIGKAGRFPRCTWLGCGADERWYLRGPGGSQDSVASIARKALNSSGGSRALLVRQRNGTCVKINSAFSSREEL